MNDEQLYKDGIIMILFGAVFEKARQRKAV